MKTKLAFLAIVMGSLSVHTMAQSDFSPGSSEEQQVVPPAAGASVIPDSALTKYEYGEAPFYVRVRSYARKLNRAFTRPIEAFKTQEMNAIGVSSDDLEQINIYLKAFSDQQKSGWSAALRAKCQELGSRSLGDEEAKVFVMELDNREAALDKLSGESMAAIANDLGEDVRGRVEARIAAEGEKIVFTKVNLSKQIEMDGGSSFAFINSQCEAL